MKLWMQSAYHNEWLAQNRSTVHRDRLCILNPKVWNLKCSEIWDRLTVDRRYQWAILHLTKGGKIGHMSDTIYNYTSRLRVCFVYETWNEFHVCLGTLSQDSSFYTKTNILKSQNLLQGAPPAVAGGRVTCESPSSQAHLGRGALCLREHFGRAQHCDLVEVCPAGSTYLSTPARSISDLEEGFPPSVKTG